MCTSVVTEKVLGGLHNTDTQVLSYFTCCIDMGINITMLHLRNVFRVSLLASFTWCTDTGFNSTMLHLTFFVLVCLEWVEYFVP